jgi:hypothetical protein
MYIVQNPRKPFQDIYKRVQANLTGNMTLPLKFKGPLQKIPSSQWWLVNNPEIKQVLDETITDSPTHRCE